FLITKGAPEQMTPSASFYEEKGKEKKIDKKNISLLQDEYTKLSSDGYRVLAVAMKKVKERKTVYTKNDETDLVLLGYVAFFDPPKQGLKTILPEIKQMGIEVKVITGDNELVTKKIADEVGLE